VIGGKWGVAIVNGSHHGEVVVDWNSYKIPCRNMYCVHCTAKNYFTFQTIAIMQTAD